MSIPNYICAFGSSKDHARRLDPSVIVFPPKVDGKCYTCVLNFAMNLAPKPGKVSPNSIQMLPTSLYLYIFLRNKGTDMRSYYIFPHRLEFNCLNDHTVLCWSYIHIYHLWFLFPAYSTIRIRNIFITPYQFKGKLYHLAQIYSEDLWEDWPENIPRRPDFHYVDPQTTSVLETVVPRSRAFGKVIHVYKPHWLLPLFWNCLFQLILLGLFHLFNLILGQKLIFPRLLFGPAKATSICESETANSALSSRPFLSSLLSIRSRVLQPEQNSHTDHDHESQPDIES